MLENVIIVSACVLVLVPLGIVLWTVAISFMLEMFQNWNKR